MTTKSVGDQIGDIFKHEAGWEGVLIGPGKMYITSVVEGSSIKVGGIWEYDYSLSGSTCWECIGKLDSVEDIQQQYKLKKMAKFIERIEKRHVKKPSTPKK